MTERTIGRAEAVGDEPPEPSPGQELESPLVARMRAAAEFLESVAARVGDAPHRAQQLVELELHLLSPVFADQQLAAVLEGEGDALADIARIERRG